MGDLLMKGSWMQRPASCVCRGAVSECMNTIEARAHSIDFSELACPITCSLRDCCPTGRCICRRAAPRIHEGDEGRALQVGPHMPSRLTAQKRARLYAGLAARPEATTNSPRATTCYPPPQPASGATSWTGSPAASRTCATAVASPTWMS